MAKIKLMVRGKSNPSPLYVRFMASRELDLFAKTKILINPTHWDHKNEKFRNLIEIRNRDEMNVKFEKLKTHIIEQYNNDFMLGKSIDKPYLENVINSHFNRPKEESNSGKTKDQFTYYIDFSNWWLKNSSAEWQTGPNKYMSPRQVQQYESFVEIFTDFDTPYKSSIYTVNHSKIKEFVSYLEKKNYSPSTVKRYIGRLKFFLNRAEEKGIDVDKSFKQKIYVEKEESNILAPYLNEEEIDKIYKLDLSHDNSLDNIRDNFIISLWSGLRISDFNNKLNIDNISEDYIEIKTTKTGSWVAVPLHPHVKAILKKRFGNLPAHSSDKHFNEKIKVICMLCEIDQEMKGNLFDTKLGRKKTDTYKKYQLVSSHIGRRSFVTNLFGKIPNSSLVKLGGWSSEKLLLHYIKKTNREHADVLKSFWEDKYKTHE